MAKQKVRVTPGAGAPVEFTIPEGAQLDGEVRAVLSSLVSQSPEVAPDQRQNLLDMLGDGRCVIENLSSENYIDPTAQWTEAATNVTRENEASVVEFAVARSQEGGMDFDVPFATETPWRVSATEQEMVKHAADYRPSREEILAAVEGRMVFVTGRVLGMIDCFVHELGSSEGMWYFLRKQADDAVVLEDIVVPAQEASSGFCRTGPTAIIRANRDARARGMVIGAGGHSHQFMSSFSSLVDLTNAEALAIEGCSFRSISRQTERVRGKDVVVERPIAHALFSTHNARGHDWMPIFHRLYCPLCGQFECSLSTDVQIHVLGERTLSAEDERTVLAALSRVRSFTYVTGEDEAFDEAIVPARSALTVLDTKPVQARSRGKLSIVSAQQGPVHDCPALSGC